MRKQLLLVSMIALSGCSQVSQSAGVVSVEDLDRPPKAVSQPLMEYTEVWQRSRIDAQATVALTIQEDGSVAEVSVVRSTNPEIGRAAVESVKKWRFEPPTRRGLPVRVKLRVPIVSDIENTKFVMPLERAHPEHHRQRQGCALSCLTADVRERKPMHTKLNDWKNGWFGIELSLKKEEIDRVISHLQMLKEEPDQHFHLSSDYKGTGGVGDIEISVQADDEPSNMMTMGKALAPGTTIPDPNQPSQPMPLKRHG